jgi:hypothetical protein
VRVVRLALLAAMLIAPVAVAAQALEQQVKAAFLFRFLSFVEWPPAAVGGPGDPFVIAVLGADDVHAELKQIVAGRTINDRPVVVERLKDGERPGRVHVLFVGRSAAAYLRKLAAVPAVLLVAEWEDALAQGAIINFLIRDDRVRFEVAPDEAERRGLRIGARMLSVALQVKGGTARP